ncbi:MAG: glycosyltransferase 87 family protein [Actinomycetota bacterium]
MTKPAPDDAPATLPWAIGLTVAGLLVGLAIKSQCAFNSWADNFQYTRFCYNEIQALFVARGIDRGLVPYIDTRFEYPVLTGVFMDLAGRVLRALVGWRVIQSHSDAGYLFVSAAMLAPFALAVTVLLRPRVPKARLALWAAGPPTIIYVFHNWDVLAVAGAVWALVSLERGRSKLAGAALAAGASAKLFPIFFLPAFVLDRLRARTIREAPGARRVILSFLAAYAAINVPWIILSGRPPRLLDPAALGIDLRQPGTNGWLQTWLFHADRYPDYWTAWYWVAKYGRMVAPGSWWEVGFTGYRDFVNLASLVLFGLLCLGVLWKGWQRRTEPAGYPVAVVALGLVVAFLLTSKVYSPQYALWVVPMLVMLNIPWRLVAGWVAAEGAVLVCGFYWFTVFDQPASAWMGALEASVWVRAVVLVLLLRCSLTASRAFPAAVRARV